MGVNALKLLHPVQPIEIDHIVLKCRDLALMQDFYVRILNCKVECVRPRLTHLRAGTSLIDLVPFDLADAEMDRQKVDHFAIRLANWDGEKLLAHLDRCEVQHGEIAERFGAAGFGPSIYVFDPEDNQVELKGVAL
tara:strand:- start:164 stop:571 length:408 start_codon:yes stop_codon:yes gene_type:complete